MQEQTLDLPLLKTRTPSVFRILMTSIFFGTFLFLVLFMGLLYSHSARAEDLDEVQPPSQTSRKVVDLGSMTLEAELRNPGEFYFQHREEEKFDSLVKRRKNFHREMLRDVVMSR